MHAPNLALCILKQQGAHVVCTERCPDEVEKALGAAH